MAGGNGQEFILAKNCKIVALVVFFLIVSLLSVCAESNLNQKEDTPTDTTTIKTESVPEADTPKAMIEYPALDIPVPDTPLYRKYYAQYSTPEGLSYLSKIMQRSTPYREFIFAELDRLEVPHWLIYLPVIESGFLPKAVSRSGATGIWQFMRNSIGGYGIRINEWMDERRDPWLTTTAAIRKLKDNHNYFGDWPLALAAYNCGLGATKNAMKKSGLNDYWDISQKGFFKPESAHYVPKLFAIATILSKSEELGIDWGTAQDQQELTNIPVSRPVDMNVLAKETGIKPEELTSLNPSLYYSITPPGLPYNLRIPASYQEAVAALLEDHSRILLEYYLYTIKSGDTLFALSLHYGVSVDMILQYNSGISPRTLQLGKKLVIPALREVHAYSGKKDRDDLNFTGNYWVTKGDTLWSIALAYGVQVETLADKNNLQVNSILKLGKQLRVPIL